ncbi:MAG: GAF domain-containing protein [Anaerolineae bacterium]|jgi:PAS domain S-box-containing protein
MTKSKILIVEGDTRLAWDVEHTLDRLGYTVSAIVSSGKQAIEETAEVEPNVVLIGRQVKGELDGREVAEQIQDRFDVPVIYLTPSVDVRTLLHAKETEPFRYVPEPFDERELHSAIEMALYKHRTEKKLKELDERYRVLVERSLQGIVIIQDFRIVLANTALAEISGYTVDELTSFSPEEIREGVHPADQALIWERLQDRLQGKEVPQRYEYRIVRKDGTVRWLEMFASRIEYHRRPAIQGTIVDITERKEAEEALRESEEKYRNAVERANDGIAIIQDGIVKYANPRLAEMWGGAAEEMVGAPFTDYVHPDELPKATDRYRRHMAGDDVLPLYETIIRRRDGGSAYAELSSGTITYRGEPANLVVVRDITERKRAERALERRAAQLATLSRIGHQVTSILEQQQLLQQTVDAVQEDLGYLLAAILLVDEEVQELYVAAATDNLQEIIPNGYRQPVGKGLIGTAAETGEMVLVNDVASDPRAYRAKKWLSPSSLSAPIRIGQQVTGVLQVDADVPNAFDENDAMAISTLADQLAIAIENARLFQAERQQRQLAEALEEAAAVVSSTLDLDQVLDRILRQVEQVVAGDAFNIMLIEEGDALVVRSRGYERLGDGRRVVPPPFAIPIGRYPYLVRMVEKRKPVVVPDTAAALDWIREVGQDWLRSYVAAPIRVAGVTVGFLNVNGTRPGQFDSDDARRLEAFGHHAAIAVENARLYQETTRRLAQTQVLREVMLAAAPTLHFDQVLERTLETLQATMGAEFIGFLLADEDGEGLRVHHSQIGFPSRPDSFRLQLDGSVCGHVFQTGKPMMIGDVREIPFYYEAVKGVRSELAVPVSVSGQVIGVLNVESTVRNAFNREDLAFYTTIAGQLGIALENARLYEEVSRQAGELAAAVTQLEELDRLKSEFIQNVSHELRSPLALILGYAEMLDRGELGGLTSEQEAPIRVIARRSQMLSQLVQDITLVLEAEVNPPEPEPVALDRLVRAAAEEFQLAVEQNQLALHTEIASHVPPVGSSPNYLRRVLDNLMSNAIKFTPEGGTITLEVEPSGEGVALRVSDTGIGIPADQQPRVFERFYQVDGSATRRYQGAGLGLALVKEIVNAYGGTVDVESEVGEGSTFTVVLPVFEEAIRENSEPDV